MNIVPLKFSFRFFSVLGLFVGVGGITDSAAKTAFKSEKAEFPSLTASLISYNRFHDLIVNRSQVSMNRSGIRVIEVRGSDDRPHNEFIQDFNADMAWFVSIKRRIYTTFPLIESEPDQSSPQKTLSNANSGIMTTEPCMRYFGTLRGSAQWRGYPVELWECGSESGELIKQTYSTDWGLVVREEHINGAVSELHDLTATEFPDGWFQPASVYREVGFTEFVKGVPYLDGYDNSRWLHNKREDTAQDDLTSD